MRRRDRARRFLKWAGLMLCALLLIVWVASYWIVLYPKWLKEDCTWFIGLGHGYVECYYPAGVLTYQSGMLFGRVMGLRPTWLPVVQRIATVGGASCWYVGVPLWLPFLALAGPTAMLWHRDRRPPPGHCRNCGYNLTGNTSGRCPECGESVPPRSERAGHP